MIFCRWIYSPGVIPIFSLKAMLKVTVEWNPDMTDSSFTLIRGFSSISLTLYCTLYSFMN